MKNRIHHKINTLGIKKMVENEAIKIRLMKFENHKPRRLKNEDSQNFDNLTNSEESLSEPQEKTRQSFLFEEESPDKNTLIEDIDSWSNINQASGKDFKNKGNATYKNRNSFVWKDETSLNKLPVSLSANRSKKMSMNIGFNDNFAFDLKKSSVINFPLKKEQNLFNMDFENMKIYLVYFPHNNINRILKQSWYLVGTLGRNTELTKYSSGIQLWKQKKKRKSRKKQGNLFMNHGFKNIFRKKEKQMTYF